MSIYLPAEDLTLYTLLRMLKGTTNIQVSLQTPYFNLNLTMLREIKTQFRVLIRKKNPQNIPKGLSNTQYNYYCS